MLKSILVGLDDSEYSAAAVDFGIQLALAHDCLLTGVAILNEPLFRDSTPVAKLSTAFRPTYDKLVHEAHEHCQALLARFTQQASATHVRHQAWEDIGLPAEQLTIESQRFDLLLLGQETHFQFEATTRACQTLQQVLHNPPRPVIAVPKQPLPGEGVLVAYDGSVAAARGLYALVASGLAHTGPVFIVTIDLDNAASALHVAERASEFLAQHGIAATVIPLQSQASPSELILDQARARGVKMISLGAYGRSGVAEWLFGSTTKHMLQRSPFPLFLFH
jgi:nucleotide-binding universal stress UspA family protein